MSGTNNPTPDQLPPASTANQTDILQAAQLNADGSYTQRGLTAAQLATLLATKVTIGGIIRFGSGAPAAAVGNNGDGYIDDQAWILYGPKASGAWPGQGISLIGPQGPAGVEGIPGANGNTIFYGTAPPNVNEGNNGDTYIQITSSAMLVYGPKTGDAWPVATELALSNPATPIAIGLVKPGPGITVDETGALLLDFSSSEGATAFGTAYQAWLLSLSTAPVASGPTWWNNGGVPNYS